MYVKYDDAITALHEIYAEVPQGSVLGPVLYLLYTVDLPTHHRVTVGPFADDTAVLASNILQTSLYKIEKWLRTWRIKVNESKSIQITFINRQGTCPPITLNSVQIPQDDQVKYLGLCLDRRLKWRKHMFAKRKQLGLQLRKIYWMIRRPSNLPLESKLLLYKAILKPIWMYGIQLWGTSAHSNIEILQRFQSKVLRMLVDAPWYITNDQIHHDLRIPTVKEEIQSYAQKHARRLIAHPNLSASQLTKLSTVRRKRKMPQDLVN